MTSSYWAHETAIIDDGAKVGPGSKLWHWVHVCSKVEIGKDCSFGQNVYVGNDVVIGDNVRIQNNVSVFDRVTLEDNVFCGPSMVFTNVVNPRSEFPRKNELKSTLVKRGATIGANATIVCGSTIGDYAFIAAGAVVTSDVRPYALMVGVPAVQKGWMSRFGEKIDLPVSGDGQYQCPHTKELYKLEGDSLRMIS